MSGNASQNSPERIWLAAIRMQNGTIFTGKHHGDCLLTAIRVNQLDEYIGSNQQGFVTDRYRFVDRHEAGEIAYKAGQIDKPTDCLISEDLGRTGISQESPI